MTLLGQGRCVMWTGPFIHFLHQAFSALILKLGIGRETDCFLSSMPSGAHLESLLPSNEMSGVSGKQRNGWRSTLVVAWALPFPGFICEGQEGKNKPAPVPLRPAQQWLYVALWKCGRNQGLSAMNLHCAPGAPNLRRTFPGLGGCLGGMSVGSEG